MTRRQYNRLMGHIEPVAMDKYERMKNTVGEGNFNSNANTMQQGMFKICVFFFFHL